MSNLDDSAFPPFDLPRIVEAFNRHGVSYITIGGVSGFLHGMVHYVTQDVDMMVQSSHENAHRILSALGELGADVDGLKTGDVAANTQWNTPSGPIDILLTALGPNETVITFSELNRFSEMIEIANGLLVPTASLDDVIRMKEAADRVRTTRLYPSCVGSAATSIQSVHETSIRFRTCQSTRTNTNPTDSSRHDPRNLSSPQRPESPFHTTVDEINEIVNARG